mmetsp:Transcript_5511/g.8394  ORF Transcript_5511/g.8394 Transcript_5511/m.8394 type:complete len:224 (+) Transcript_5511:96-767(+)
MKRSGSGSSEENYGYKKLRSGKWSPQEEQFARSVISDFEKGVLVDCTNGTTLRAYLSRKLQCSPMRISKKFAGTSIGKLTYLSRLNNTSSQPVQNSRRDITLSTDIKNTIVPNQYAAPSRGPGGINVKTEVVCPRENFSHPELQRESRDISTTTSPAVSSAHWPFECPTLDYYRETLLPSPSFSSNGDMWPPTCSSWFCELEGVFDDEPHSSPFSASSDDFDY